MIVFIAHFSVVDKKNSKYIYSLTQLTINYKQNVRTQQLRISNFQTVLILTNTKLVLLLMFSCAFIYNCLLYIMDL